MIDKIPKDVELAATYALDAIHRSDSQYEWQAIIARAILAERKRCAAKARLYGRGKQGIAASEAIAEAIESSQ